MAGVIGAIVLVILIFDGIMYSLGYQYQPINSKHQKPNHWGGLVNPHSELEVESDLDLN